MLEFEYMSGVEGGRKGGAVTFVTFGMGGGGRGVTCAGKEGYCLMFAASVIPD